MSNRCPALCKGLLYLADYGRDILVVSERESEGSKRLLCVKSRRAYPTIHDVEGSEDELGTVMPCKVDLYVYNTRTLFCDLTFAGPGTSLTTMAR